MSEKLKPCPACNGEAKHSDIGSHVKCMNRNCCLMGPSFDGDCAKWNALPRRGDATALMLASMTDGELTARTAIGACDGENPFPFWVGRTEEGRQWHENNAAEVRAELDRRAAARKGS